MGGGPGIPAVPAAAANKPPGGLPLYTLNFIE